MAVQIDFDFVNIAANPIALQGQGDSDGFYIFNQENVVGTSSSTDLGNTATIGGGVEATVIVGADIDANSNQSTTSLDAIAGVRIEGQATAEAEAGPVSATATATVSDGAAAKTETEILHGDGNAGFKTESSASAGPNASLEGSATADTGVASATVGGGVSYGLSAEAGAEATFEDGVITLGVSGGFAAGLGFKLDVEFSFDVNKFDHIMSQHAMQLYQRPWEQSQYNELMEGYVNDWAEENDAQELVDVFIDILKYSDASIYAKDIIDEANNIANLAESTWNDLEDSANFVSNIAQNALNDLELAADSLEEIGKDIGEGVEDAANTIADGATDAANTIADGATDAANTLYDGGSDAVKETGKWFSSVFGGGSGGSKTEKSSAEPLSPEAQANLDEITDSLASFGELWGHSNAEQMAQPSVGQPPVNPSMVEETVDSVLVLNEMDLPFQNGSALEGLAGWMLGFDIGDLSALYGPVEEDHLGDEVEPRCVDEDHFEFTGSSTSISFPAEADMVEVHVGPAVSIEDEVAQTPVNEEYSTEAQIADSALTVVDDFFSFF